MIQERFIRTRKAVVELEAIKLAIAFDGEDWKPSDAVHVRGVGDPTASKAIYNVDEWGERLPLLRKREAELEEYIGLTLEIIERIRGGLGSKYADVLEARYIDCLSWRDVFVDGAQVPVTTGKRWCHVAFDWVDALGLTKLLSGDYEL